MADERRIRELIQQLKIDKEDVWLDAQTELIRIGKAAVPALIAALKNDYWEVQQGAALALGKIGNPAAPALIDALEDEDVRGAVAWTLGRIFGNFNTIEEVEDFERKLDEGLARLQKKYKDDDLVEIGFQIARLKKDIARKKNELASKRDLILEDIPKPPPKDKDRMYRALAEAGRIRR